MSCCIMNDHSSSGITVNTQELKLLQYADDMTVILKVELHIVVIDFSCGYHNVALLRNWWVSNKFF